MSWTRAAKSWFFRIRAGTRPVGALRQFSSPGSPLVSQTRSTQHSSRVLLFTSLTTGLVGFTLAKSLHRDSPESPQFGSSDDFKKAIQELQSTFPASDKVSVNPDDLHVHGFSLNDYHPGMYEQKKTTTWEIIRTSMIYVGIDHSVVVYPENTSDVVKIVKIANKYKMPVVPYSGATSFEGQFRGV